MSILEALSVMEFEDLEEILACMEHSDRYINESRKNRLMIRIKNELVKRGFTQYSDDKTVKA